MPNMRYCLFQNTLNDLRDCYAALVEDGGVEKLSNDERAAAFKLIQICGEIAEDFGEDAGND